MVLAEAPQILGQHPSDGARVKVLARWNQPKGKKKDRLICLQHEGHNQVVMVNIDLFKKEPTDTDEMTEQRAWDWMLDIGDKYVKQELDSDGCVAEKKKLLPPVMKAAKMKRPAAAGAPGEAGAAADAAAPAHAQAQAAAEAQAAAPSEAPASGVHAAAPADQPLQDPALDDSDIRTPKRSKRKASTGTPQYKAISPPPPSSAAGSMSD